MTFPALPSKSPEPSEWLRAYAKVQTVSDAEVRRLLIRAYRDVSKQITSILGRNPGLSQKVRLEQLLAVRRGMLNELSTLYAGLGRTIVAGDLLAAAQASRLSFEVSAPLFAAAGASPELVSALQAGFNRSLENAGIEAMVTRVTQSQFTLAQRIYNSQKWTAGQVDRVINSALARGLSAREFAAEARGLFNPNTPGGVRFASYRLARTEINNSFHATSVNRSDHPWITGMQWNLSRSHPKADDCDTLAHEDGFRLGPGVFPVRDTPRKPHPQCFCYVTPVPIDEEQFITNLVSGQYDAHIAQEIGVPQRIVSPPAPAITRPAPAPPAAVLAPRPFGVPRPVLDAATSVPDVIRIFEAQTERITGGRQIPAVMSGDLQTAKEHAEGILRMMEEFPRTNLQELNVGARGTHEDAYAWANIDSANVSFNELWSEAREAYLDTLQRGIADWNVQRFDKVTRLRAQPTSWAPRNTGNPAHVAIHELAHVLTLSTLDEASLTKAIEALVEERRLELTAERYAERVRAELPPINHPFSTQQTISQEVSEYAAKNTRELMAEGMLDALVNGAAASKLSQGILDIVRKAYQRRFPGR